MKHVALDTSIFRNNPTFNSLGFRALARLCKAEVYQLHLPYIVEREFQTQQVELITRDSKKALSGIKSLKRKPSSKGLQETLSEIEASIKDASIAAKKEAENQIVDWAESIDAIRHPLSLDEATKAMEAYFKGTVPLKEPKIRDDIPDSFLVRSLENIAIQSGNLVVVATDKKVRDSFYDNAAVQTFDSLSAFIESEGVQEQIKELDLLEQFDEIKSAITAFEEDTSEISSAVASQIGSQLLYKTITGESIPDDNHEATIMSEDEPEEVDLDFDQFAYYGYGLFGLGFSLSMPVQAYYYIFKSDYYTLDPDFLPSISDHNEHYFEAEQEFQICVNGIVMIQVDRENLDLNEISESIDPDLILIDEIEEIEVC